MRMCVYKINCDLRIRESIESYIDDYRFVWFGGMLEDCVNVWSIVEWIGERDGGD